MKKTTLMAGLLFTAGFSGVALAHDYGGKLGTGAAATDRFYIICSTGTTKMTWQVRRNATPSPSTVNLKLCGLKTTAACPSTNATTSSGTGAFSAVKTLASGAGAYFFTLNKSPALPTSSIVSYTVRAHCWQGTTHDPNSQPTTVTYLLNQ